MAGIPADPRPRSDCRPRAPSALSLGIDPGELYREVRHAELRFLGLVGAEGGLRRFEQRPAVLAWEETSGDDGVHAWPHGLEYIVQLRVAKDRCLAADLP